MKRTGLLLLGLALVAGCGTPSVYRWGQYEEMIYTAYRTPDKMPPERQAEILEKDLQVAEGKGKPVPPGFHAHLGYIYYELGRTEAARSQFEIEKEKFPESTVFMDRLLSKLSAPAKEAKK